MSDPIELHASWWQLFWTSLIGAAGYCVSKVWTWISGWVSSMQSRIETLEKTVVSLQELTKSLSEIRIEIRDMHQENRPTLQRIEEKLEATFVIDARLTRAEKDIQDLRDYKHEKMIPYVNDINKLEGRVRSLEAREGREQS